MKKIQRLYYDACKEALNNSRQWLEDANYLLYNRDSFGHSLSLIFFSIEESVKAWICFSVGIGKVEHTEDVVKEIFRDHSAKMGDAIVFWMMMMIPRLMKPFYEELNEEELTQHKAFYTQFDQAYENIVTKMVEYRKSGIYVDVKEGKILSPSIFTKVEVEAFFLDALSFVRFFELIVERYESADEETRKSMLDSMGERIRLGVDNFDRIIKESES